MTHQKQPGRRGFKKRNIFLMLLLAGLGAFGVFRFHVHHQLMQRIEALQAQGYPMSMNELDAWYRESHPYDVNNAWPAYLGAFESLVKWDGEASDALPGYARNNLYSPGEPWTPEHLQQARTFLKDNDICLNLLHKGAGMGSSFRPLDFSRGHAMFIPWLSESRDCARLLRLASRVAVQQGDIDEAVRAIKAIFALADSLDAPVTVMNLVRYSIWGLGIESIQDLLGCQSLTLEQIKTLEARLAPVELEEGYRKGMIGERCFVLLTFNASPTELGMFTSNSGGNDQWALMIIPRKIVGLHDLDALSCINMMQEYIEAASLPRHKIGARIQEIDAEYGPKLGMLTRRLMPAIGRIYQIESRIVARSLCARAALAVERCRLATGQVPGTLESLVPTYMPSMVDPFDGQPLRFRHLDKGYVVYSVGQDLADNQGRERETGKAAEDKITWDETFTVAR